MLHAQPCTRSGGSFAADELRLGKPTPDGRRDAAFAGRHAQWLQAVNLDDPPLSRKEKKIEYTYLILIKLYRLYQKHLMSLLAGRGKADAQSYEGARFF